MKTDETITMILILFTMALGTVSLVRFNRKRDERESQAFYKALKFASITSVFLAGIGGCIAISFNNFNVPIMYIFILLIISFALMLLMYEVYLLIESLEPPFIAKMSKEKKVKFYNYLLAIDMIVLFAFMACGMYFSNIRKIEYKTFSPFTIAQFICIYIEFIILTNMPRKKLNKVEEIKVKNRKKTLIIICILSGIISGAVTFTFLQIL